MKKYLILTVLAVLFIIVLIVSCSKDKSPTGPEPSPFVKASDWVAGVNWDNKTEVTINMVESGQALSFSPNTLTFEAGKPYVLKVVNPAGNASKHYFATQEVFPDFYKSIATRKIETADAEYKAPYFRAVELLIGGELEIFFVPVLAGEYDFLCTIPGHAEAGMTGKITITGGEGYELDLEVDSGFDTGLITDARTSGSHAVWTDARELTVEMVENADGSLAYNPSTLNLMVGKGYKINIVNASGHASKHYYTASEFYKTVVTRKAEDGYAEIKMPYMKAVELLIGGKTELFMVPTKAGSYEVFCTIPGHRDAGMEGLVVIVDNAPSPFVNASDWVANVNWDERQEVEIEMVESGASLSFSPNNLTFEAGKPYVLKVVNPAGNASKHYFATQEVFPDFYKAIATRKIETADAEYKAPYFRAVELLIGGELEIFFVPVIAGTYDFLCTIPGHADAGMTGKITITGGAGYELDLEVDSGFDTGLITDPRTSGSHDVWTTAEEITVEMVENADGSLAYNPSDLNLTKDKGYIIHIVNAAGHVSKHYYTAAEFYKTVVTRKAEDGYGEIKMPYMKAVELLIGGETELFMVPTQTGTFEVFCTITGHRDAGMEGLVIVVE
ncbi:MAG: plastocyanin/azurin family copper-binding protein [bacterium]